MPIQKKAHITLLGTIQSVECLGSMMTPLLSLGSEPCILGGIDTSPEEITGFAVMSSSELSGKILHYPVAVPGFVSIQKYSLSFRNAHVSSLQMMLSGVRCCPYNSFSVSDNQTTKLALKSVFHCRPCGLSRSGTGATYPFFPFARTSFISSLARHFHFPSAIFLTYKQKRYMGYNKCVYDSLHQKYHQYLELQVVCVLRCTTVT